MIIGYARTSLKSAELDDQVIQLKAAGCDVIRWDVREPPGERMVLTEGIHLRRMCDLHQIFMRIDAGDVLVVCRLDRLGRSLSFVIELINWLHSHGASLRSLGEQIDTAAPQGMPVLRLTAALADAERILLAEQEEDTAAVAGTGEKLPDRNRPTLQQIDHVRKQHTIREQTFDHIADVLGVDRDSLDRAARGQRPAEGG